MLLLALWIALSCNAVTLWTTWPNGLGVDYAVFWEAVRKQSDIYARVSQPFVYPPTALIWFQPLRLLAFWPGFVAWSAVSLLLFWLATVRLYELKAATLAIVSPAILLALLPGQTSLLAAAGLFAAYSTTPLVRGILLGAVFTFKPQLVTLAPLFLIADRDLTAIVAMALTIACFALLATFLFGPPIWIDWLSALPHFQQVIVERGFTISAASPAAFAPALGLPALPVQALGLCVGLWIVFRSTGAPPAVTAASVATASLFAAPYSLNYDMAAIAPLMAAAILSPPSKTALVACVAYTSTLGPLGLAASAYVISRREEDRDRAPAEPLAATE
jgi:Glycosyltransferase family 87